MWQLHTRSDTKVVSDSKHRNLAAAGTGLKSDTPDTDLAQSSFPQTFCRRPLGQLLRGSLLTLVVMQAGCGDSPPELLSPEDLDQELDSRTPLTASAHSQSRKYAILLNGDSPVFNAQQPLHSILARLHSRQHRLNVLSAFEALQAADYQASDIFCLSSAPPSDGDVPPLAALGSQYNLRRVVAHLRETVDENDKLVVYITGHGSAVRSSRTHGVRSMMIAFPDGVLGATSFRDLISGIPAGEYIFVADGCYSGGLVNVISISAMPGDPAAYSSTDDMHQ